MQLPSSSTPTDSNPLASLFPATMPTGSKPLPAGAAKNGKAKFDDLVDDLATDSAPATATTAGPDASTIATVLSVSFLPIPVVCPGTVVEPTGDSTSDADADVASEAVPCGLDLPAASDALTGTESAVADGGAAVRSDRQMPRTDRANQRMAGNEFKDPIAEDPSGAKKGSENKSPKSTDLHEPNDHAAEKAFETPRFAGLPATALAHRNAATLPPGIARLTALHGDTNDDSSEATGAEDDTSVEINGEGSTDVTPSPVEPDDQTAQANTDEQNPAEATGGEVPVEDSNTTEPIASTLTSSQFDSLLATGSDADVSAASFEQTSAQPSSVSGSSTESDSVDSDPSPADASDDTVTLLSDVSSSGTNPEVVTTDVSDPAVAPVRNRGVSAFAKMMSHDGAPYGRAIGRLNRAEHETETDDDSASFGPKGLEKTARVILPTAANATAQAALDRSPVTADAATEANFAAAKDEMSPGERIRQNSAKKSFVASEDEGVTPQRKTLGIGVAKPAATMFARFLPTPLQHPASEYAAAAVAAPKELADMIAPAFKDVSTSQSVNTAHAAVEVVLQTAEQVSAREQKSVNLHFSVGDADLSVRVELRADEVHATFRTDSPELRAALSHEWQSLGSNSSGDRALRIVPATFTSSDQSALNAFAGDTSSRQRNPNAQRGGNERASGIVSGLRGVTTATAVASPRATGVSLAASLTSRHLQTLA